MAKEQDPKDFYTGTTPNGSTEQESNVYEDTISKALKDGNYKDYYSSAVQNYIATQASKKYLNQELQARGLASSGYAQGATAGISNAMLNANANARSLYQNANLTADQDALERKEKADLETDKELVSYLTNAMNQNLGQETIDKTMANYGYSYDEKSGSWKDKNGNDASAYIKSMYDTATRGTQMQNETESDERYFTFDELKSLPQSDDRNSSTYYGAEGDKNAFNYELDALQKASQRGTLNDGSVILLENEWGNKVYLKVKKNSGGTYTYSLSNESEYNNSTDKKSNKQGQWVK